MNRVIALDSKDSCSRGLDLDAEAFANTGRSCSARLSTRTRGAPCRRVHERNIDPTFSAPLVDGGSARAEDPCYEDTPGMPELCSSKEFGDSPSNPGASENLFRRQRILNDRYHVCWLYRLYQVMVNAGCDKTSASVLITAATHGNQESMSSFG
jgi:hypothetical protein